MITLSRKTVRRGEILFDWETFWNYPQSISKAIGTSLSLVIPFSETLAGTKMGGRHRGP